MLLYDTTITSELELEVVWRRRIRLGSVLHVLNRYCSLGGYIVILILLYPVSDLVRLVLVFAGLVSCIQYTDVDVVQTYAIIPEMIHKPDHLRLTDNDRCRCGGIISEILTLLPYISWACMCCDRRFVLDTDPLEKFLQGFARKR